MKASELVDQRDTIINYIDDFSEFVLADEFDDLPQSMQDRIWDYIRGLHRSVFSLTTLISKWGVPCE